VLAETFAGRQPPQLQAAVQGVARFSHTLAERDAELRSLLSKRQQGDRHSRPAQQRHRRLGTTPMRCSQQLESQSNALDQLSNNFAGMAQQLKGLIADNRATLKPALDWLNGV
jgi:phospholipid/cholesterol/gamma-HCH transport system substrate-binding protein